MAKGKVPEPVDYRPTVPEMQQGLRKIARRKGELLALDPNAIQRQENERIFEGWPPIWNDTIAEIFTRDSIQFREYGVHSLDQPESVTMGFGDSGYDDQPLGGQRRKALTWRKES